MARKKSFKVSEEEMVEAGVKPDFFQDLRSSDGFIKVSFNRESVQRRSMSTEREIEEREREIEELRRRQRNLEKAEEKLGKLSKKEKKKRKKKEKKEKKKLKQIPESSRILFGAIEEYKHNYHKSKKDKLKEKEKFEGVTIKDKAKRGQPKEDEETVRRRKEEKEKKDFDQKFDEPITLIRQTVVEVDKTIEEINKLIDEAKESRARNKSTMIKDLLGAKTGLLSNRTMSARAIGDLQKTRLDMEDKRQKKVNETKNDANNNVALISKLFPHLMGNMSKQAVSAKANGSRDKDDKDSKKDKKKKKERVGEDRLIERTADLIKSGAISLTPYEASIDMEGQYTVAVKKSFKTHDFEFIALDRNGNVIKDFKTKYPGLLPKKKNHDLRFDDEKDICKCTRTDQVFQVISVPYL